MALACLRPELHAEPSVCRYTRRQPEKTLLYQTVQGHLAAFFTQCETFDRSIPLFIKDELEAFLRCGILAHGFARIYCGECRYDRLVAFSCKKRGFCGSCMARRMSETAAHLVDSVIPPIPTRQWVLSVPVSLPPTLTDIRDITEKVAGRVHRWLEKRIQNAGEEDALQQKQPLLANCYASSLRYLSAFGNNAGRSLMRVFENMPDDNSPSREERGCVGSATP